MNDSHSEKDIEEFAKFLQEYPLFRKFEYKFPQRDVLADIPKPSIDLECKNCSSIETFISPLDNVTKEIEYAFSGAVHRKQIITPDILTARLSYLCMKCMKYKYTFFLKWIDDSTVLKIGQYPPWNIAIERNLSKVLGDYKDIYKKGLICESQSYGIGAHAYYRRIVELIIDGLLENLSDLVERDEEKEKYKLGLLEAKNTKVAEDKINCVKDLLPESLKPDGMNPLKILYDSLSKGLHTDTDEECLNKAGKIRVCLKYLIEEVSRTRERRNEFIDSLKQLSKLKDDKD